MHLLLPCVPFFPHTDLHGAYKEHFKIYSRPIHRIVYGSYDLNFLLTIIQETKGPNRSQTLGILLPSQNSCIQIQMSDMNWVIFMCPPTALLYMCKNATRQLTRSACPALCHAFAHSY